MPHDFVPATWSLSKWLAVKTSVARQVVVKCIDTHQPVSNETNCQQLLGAHLRFHELVEPIYVDPNLRRMLLAFFENRRSQLFKPHALRKITPDIQTSGRERSLPMGLLPRMGWLYATEFVDFGLTQLLTHPTVGQLRFKVDWDQQSSDWQAFRHELDVLRLSETDEEHLAKAACSALISYSAMFNGAYRS